MAASPQFVVSARGLNHRYKAITALDNVDLRISASQTVGLIGPDGVGKSTLLGLIAGARKLQTGTLTVLDSDIARTKQRRQVQPRIAYMPQGLGKNLYTDLTVAENLDFFGKLFGQGEHERRSRIARLTRSTGLDPFLERPVGKLSGGMKQKLGLCCSLIHDPDLLILDEPTTGVDPLSRRRFWELLDGLKTERAEMSLIVSSAYMEEAEAFDWLIAMNNGQILGTGTPAELMQRTETTTLEDAYVALLPDAPARGNNSVELPKLVTSDSEPAIVAHGLTRQFGDFTAVDDVSFSIRPGEIFGFLGSNGCGKTTTMKMLTGLLPPSSGEAYLFGEPIDAGSVSIRRRVGYMSQAFSLYSELTVRQNLDLHARLFKLKDAAIQHRVIELANRFDLVSHLDTLSDQLPLGLKQRLSLAVAVLHKPEMLILDEPTSGVDPQARDDFWRLLGDLSRRDGVTIFVSTHFMNEAMRCDRISFMHAGRVLAIGTPQELIEAQSAQNLDDAFVAYMIDASDEEDPAGQAEPSRLADVRDRTVQHADRPQYSSIVSESLGINIMRLLAYSARETKEVMRDPVRLAFAFIGSTILLFIFSYGITTDVNNVKFAVLDQDRTPASRAFVAHLQGSRYFEQAESLTSMQDLMAQLAAHRIPVALEIPRQFGRRLKRGSRPEISVWIDGANTMRASTISGYVEGAHANFLQQLAVETGRAGQAAPPLDVETRYLYNPSFESIYAIGPAVPAMLLILFPAILMAVSVVREKEIGTITNFYVTPTQRLEFLLGKQLPYVGIAMVNFAIMTVIVVFVFGVPLKGSLVALALGAFAYAAATTGYGLVIATVTSSQVAAVFATAILSLMPTFQFSGFLQPVSALEGGAFVIGNLWPATYYMHMSVGAFTKGLGLAE